MDLVFSSISQSYGKQQLFNSLQLTIPSGSFFTLLGPSGCGKTTLLRMLAGFVRPDSGQIFFGDDDVTRIPAHKRNVGMVFQDYALFPDRSVVDNVSYGLLARGHTKASAKSASLLMLDRVGLGAYAQRMPSELSGGQRQRVAMARALVIQPSVLLLDEPLSALDVKLRVELRNMVRELQQEAGLTTVFVTHDQEEALSISDHIAVMRSGEVVQIGSPHTIYAQPETRFTADFVGGANIIPLRQELLMSVSGARRFDCGAGIVHCFHKRPWEPNLCLAVRPEKLRFIEDSPSTEGSLEGQIVTVEFLGALTRYKVRTTCSDLWLNAWSHTYGATKKLHDQVVVAIPHDAVLVRGL